MEISLLDNIHDPSILNISYWQRIQDAIDGQTKPGSSRIAELRNISQSHQNTRDRITFAEYHTHNLDQIYISHTTPRYTETPRWAMAERKHKPENTMTHDIITIKQELDKAVQEKMGLSQIYYSNINNS